MAAMTWVGVSALLRRVARGWVDDSVGDTAAALTYYGILSVFPGLLLLVAALGLLLNQRSTAMIAEALVHIGPNTAAEMIRTRLVAIEHTSSISLLVLGLAGTLWGTITAVVTLMDALNRCYVVRETRRFWRRWALALATTGIGAVTGVVAVTAIFVTPLLARHLGGRGELIVRWLRLPVAALSVTTLWALLYWALPNRKSRFRLFTPGAIVGAVLWVAASLALSAYVHRSRTFEVTYGALGGVTMMLLWMWISSAAILVGAEVNEALGAQRTAPRDGSGEPGPRTYAANEPLNRPGAGREGTAMLRSLKDLEGYAVSATDGHIGSVYNFLIDDEKWVIRYLVVDTARFFGRQRALVSPTACRQADWSSRRFHVALTKAKIENSPGIDADKPVSRQHERDYHRYYGYPHYWGFAGTSGLIGYPGPLAEGGWQEVPAEDSNETNDVHLRSAREVRGYHIEGSDAAIGHVADFVVDDETWTIRYLVIDTRNWWFGKKVLVAPEWASRIDWDEKKVHVDLTRQAIKDSPEWDPSAGVNREFESRLYDYYGRPVYWDDDLSSPRPPSDHSAHLGSS